MFKTKFDYYDSSKFDFDNPKTPLARLNNNPIVVFILKTIIKVYGLNVVQYWITSGEYTHSEYE